MDRELKIKVVLGHDDKPLAEVKNFPGLNALMNSQELKEMASQLLKASELLDKKSV